MLRQHQTLVGILPPSIMLPSLPLRCLFKGGGRCSDTPSLPPALCRSEALAAWWLGYQRLGSSFMTVTLVLYMSGASCSAPFVILAAMMSLSELLGECRATWKQLAPNLLTHSAVSCRICIVRVLTVRQWFRHQLC